MTTRPQRARDNFELRNQINQLITDAAMRHLTPADFETPDPEGTRRLNAALADPDSQTGGGAAWGVLSVAAVLMIACACIVAVLLLRGWLRAGP